MIDQLCRELLRFLWSLDHSGLILQTALEEADALPPGYIPPLVPPESPPLPIRRSMSETTGETSGGPNIHIFPSSSDSQPLGQQSSTTNKFSPSEAHPDTLLSVGRSPSAPAALQPLGHRKTMSSNHLGLGALMSRVGLSLPSVQEGMFNSTPVARMRTLSRPSPQNIPNKLGKGKGSEGKESEEEP
jgi:RAB6A-GEF complex partner protein 1